MSDSLAPTLGLPPRSARGSPRAATPAANLDALSLGTRLDEFEIVRVLGSGGFGIVYLAYDHVLQRQVAIKEYMPTSLARRSDGADVSMRSTGSAQTFERGLESFVHEARLLAGFDHPALVRVHRFWKANGTAYMAMQYYPGLTLKQARRAMAAAPTASWLRAFVEPLLAVLDLLHRNGVYHRDIAPDNILLLPDGRPVLLDFGAARRVIGDGTQSLTAVLKPNFSPIEQYADDASLRQGPWTDLYALGATVHFALTGDAPTPAVLRAVKDTMPALSTLDDPGFVDMPNAFLATIDWTLALAPGDRPQSVAALRQALDNQVLPPQPSPRHPIEASRLDEAVGDMHGTADAVVRGAPSVVPTVEQRPLALRQSGAAPPVPVRNNRGTLKALVAIAGATVLAWSLLAPEASVPAPALQIAPAQTPGPATAPSASAAAADAKEAAIAAKPPSLPVAPASRPRQPTASVAARSPKAFCGDLNFVALAICLSRECQTPRWRDHAQCVEPRAIEEQRRRHIEQL